MIAGKWYKVKGVSLDSFYALLVKSLLEGEKPNAPPLLLYLSAAIQAVLTVKENKSFLFSH